MSRCALCGGAVALTERFGEPLLAHCGDCGSCFAIAGRADAVRSYGTDAYLDRNADTQIDAVQRRHEARLRLRWVRSQRPAGTLFEAGAGAGFFLDEARAAGYAVRGVEPSPALSAFARDRLGLEVETCLAEHARVRDESDVACLWHVLEHADEPVGLLRAVAARVRPGGHVFLEVPNVASPVAKRLGRRWPALASPEHLTHFTPEGLRRALLAAGLAPVEMFTIARWRYRRPRTWASPRVLASAVRDCALARRVVWRDASRGDLLRAVARV